MDDLTKKYKYFLILMVSLLLVLIFLLGVFVWFQFNNKVNRNTPANLRLVVPKDKIIDYTLIPAKGDNIVKYHYISDQEVSPAVHDSLKEDISKRTGNSLTFLKSIKPINDKLQEEKYISRIYPAKTFEKVKDKWYQVETATTTEVVFYEQTRLTALDQIKKSFGQKVLADTFYSGSGDGFVAKGNSLVWSTTHDATTGSTFDFTNTTILIESITNPFNGNYVIARGFLPFDTSVISNNASIISARLYFYPTYFGNGDAFLNIVQTSQASSATLTIDDYDTAGAVTNPTVGATAIYISSLTLDTYNSFDLNSTGLGWIKQDGQTSNCGTVAGYTCLGIRDGSEMANSTSNGGIIYISSSEETGTSQDPYLEVTYTTIAPSKIKIDGGTIKIDGGTIKID